MSEEEYVDPTVDDDHDDGTMPRNIKQLADAVIGHKIVSAERKHVPDSTYSWRDTHGLVLTLDTGKQVTLLNSDDCCAYTDLEDFFLDPASVDHVITGVTTEDGYTRWRLFADYGDILKLTVDWSPGNPFYYGYGFYIAVKEPES